MLAASEFLASLLPPVPATPSITDPPYEQVLGVACTHGHNVRLLADPALLVQVCASLPGPVHDDFPACVPPTPAPSKALSVNRAVPDDASILAVSVVPEVLHASGLYGAAALGRYEDVKGRQDVRSLLRKLMELGIPLLVATGRDRQELVDAKIANASKRFGAGSPLLLCDKAGSLICVAVPMGNVMVARDEASGMLPIELRRGVAAATSVQMFVQVICVAPRPKFEVQEWFKNHDAAFRWDLVKKSANSTSVVPVNAVFVDLFNKYGSLTVLRACLGDYEAKLAALSTVPQAGRIPPAPLGKPPQYGAKKAEYDRKIQQQRRELADNPVMITEWRRALLVQRVLEEDTLGTAYAALAGVLPERMVGPARACTVDPMQDFEVADLRGVDPTILDEILTCAGGGRMQ